MTEPPIRRRDAGRNNRSIERDRSTSPRNGPNFNDILSKTETTVGPGADGAFEECSHGPIELGDARDPILQTTLHVHPGALRRRTGGACPPAHPERSEQLRLERVFFARELFEPAKVAARVGRLLIAREVGQPQLVFAARTRINRRVDQRFGEALTHFVASEREDVDVLARSLDEASEELN